MALLVLTILFSAGALLIKYKLEGLRAAVEHEVEARTGAEFRVGAVLVNGLRGLRMDEVQVAVNSERGPALQFWAPVAYVHLDVVELLYGNVVVTQVRADGAAIRFTQTDEKRVKREEHPPLSPVGEIQGSFEGGIVPELAQLAKTSSFRLSGNNGTLELIHVLGNARLLATNFSFDVSRLEGSPDFAAKLSGQIAPETGRNFKVDLRYTSMEDFDLRLSCALVTAEDIATLFPGSQQFIASGSMTPNVRLAGYPDMMLVVAFEAPFRDIALRNQPDFLAPADGILCGVAQYDSGTGLLTLTGAKAESYQIGGNIEGSISFAQAPPVLDLKLEAAHLPLKDALTASMAGRTEQFESLDVTMEEPYAIQMLLKGTTEHPEVSIQGDVTGGKLSFVPKSPVYPKGSLTMGRMMLNWSNAEPGPSGSFSVTDGNVVYNGIQAEKIAGTITFDKERLSIDPLNASVTGNPFVGSLKYHFKTKKAEIAASGTIAGLEKTALGHNGEISVSGAANVRGTMVKDDKGITLEGELDATQSELRYQAWLVKPAGVGATAKQVRAKIDGTKTASFSAAVDIASCEGKIRGRLEKRQTWRLTELKAQTPKMDITAACKCIQVPYRISGGIGREGLLEYTRDGAGDSQWHLTGSAALDWISLLPEGAETPMHIEGVRASVMMRNEPRPEGVVTLSAKKAQMPPLRGAWFAPLRPEQKSPGAADRYWTFELAGDTVEAPPWKARNFTGQAYVEKKQAGFRKYAADIEGGGQVDGSYQRLREDNIIEVNLNWNGIPVNYLIDQLNYPHILTGPTTGTVKYSMDRDDPGTINGDAEFVVDEGQFSADYLISQLDGRVEKNQITSLPLSLKFTRLESEVDFEKDLVKTPKMSLRAPGITITADGSFVLHGDMDYDLKVALSPDLAEKIPAIRDNLNVKGLRMAQQDVELAFKVKGPTFNPQGELTRTPPVGITLVSSALELTSDAVGVIDIPRKVLVDLLRIGGGVLGVK